MHTVHDALSSDSFWHPLLLMLLVVFVVFLIFFAILVICGNAAGDAIIGAGFGVLVFVAVGIAVGLPVVKGGVASGMQAGSDTAASSRTVSDVRLCDGRAVGSLMRDPRDGSWPVTYRDSDGVERSGTAEVTGSKSGSPVLKVTGTPGVRSCSAG